MIGRPPTYPVAPVRRTMGALGWAIPPLNRGSIVFGLSSCWDAICFAVVIRSGLCPS